MSAERTNQTAVQLRLVTAATPRIPRALGPRALGFDALRALWLPCPCSTQPPERPSNQKPKLYASASPLSSEHAPVAQWIERRPPEPSRLSVVATRVGPRAKRVEFYALERSPEGRNRDGRESLGQRERSGTGMEEDAGQERVPEAVSEPN